jgi:superfamily II DNA or RNA helicase
MNTSTFSSGVVLRDYQQLAHDRIFEEFARGIKSTLLVLPTGAGKTVVFGSVARRMIDEMGGRVLVLAHRGELLTQAADKLAALGVEAAIEKAGQNARAALWGEPSCVVASVQTMRGRRLESWPRDHFSLIITDECHHSVADSYQGIYDHFRDTLHLGVTATADRLDGENLGQTYQTLAYEYSLRQAIAEENLCRLKFVRCETTVDLSDIRTIGGDLNQGDIEEAIRPHIEELANATRQEIGDRRAIVFTPDVGSAQAFASALTSLGLKAESVSGDSADRDDIFQGFRNGRFRILCNCLDDQTEILTSGGWKGIDEFRDSDITATFDPETGDISWEPVSRVVRRPREPGERMVSIKNQTLDIRVTEGHRMLVRTRGAKAWRFVEAGTLPGRICPYQLPMAGNDEADWDVFFRDGTIPPSRLEPDQCRFIGLWMADGHLDRSGGHRGVSISQSDAYPEANVEIRRILNSCGFDWRHCTSAGNLSAHRQNRYNVPKGSIGGTLARNGFACLEEYLDKDMSLLIDGLDREQFKCLVEGLWLGDGVKFKQRPPRGGVRSGWTIVNTNKLMLDRLQILAVTRGFSCNISKPKDNGPRATRPIYQITIRDRAVISTNNQWVESSGGNPANFEEIWTPERVWCVTNKTGTIITRRRGKVAVMGQCQLATEGFDAPFVSAIVLARPTKSRSLYAQMIGRGTRLSHGKENCLVIDFAWLTGRHQLVSPVELFDTTKMDQEVQALAKAMVESGETPDLMEAIEAAEAKHLERQKIRIKAREREVRYRRVSYDPFAVMDTLGMASRPEAESSLRVKPTDKQIFHLEKMGVADARSMSKRRASMMLGVLFERRDKQLATLKQISHLISNGVEPDEARSMPFAEASRRLDVIFGGRR